MNSGCIIQLKFLYEEYRPKTEANATGKQRGGQDFENTKNKSSRRTRSFSNEINSQEPAFDLAPTGRTSEVPRSSESSSSGRGENSFRSRTRRGNDCSERFGRWCRRQLSRNVPAVAFGSRPVTDIRSKCKSWPTKEHSRQQHAAPASVSLQVNTARPFMRVLRGLEPKSALEQYRGKKVGGHELISDYAQLVSLASAGVVGHLEPLYVSPDVAA